MRATVCTDLSVSPMPVVIDSFNDGEPNPAMGVITLQPAHQSQRVPYLCLEEIHQSASCARIRMVVNVRLRGDAPRRRDWMEGFSLTWHQSLL